MFKKILGVLLGAVLLASCASDPGPNTSYMGGLNPYQVMQKLDEEATEFGGYGRISPMVGCEKPLDLTDLYDSGILKLHKDSYFNTANQCTSMALGIPKFLSGIMVITGNSLMACTYYKFYEQCVPETIEVYYFADEHNGILKHELNHAKGFGDEFYGEFED